MDIYQSNGDTKSWKNFRRYLIHDGFDTILFKAVQEMNSPVGEASQSTCDKIIKGIANECCTSEPIAFIATACLLQKGGTSRSCPGGLYIRIADTVFTLDCIRRHCRAVKNTKVRQFARGLKDDIIDVMKYLGSRSPDGNLARAMMLDHNISKPEAIWCCDFHTYNPNCPESVRTWLVKNYKSRFKKG